MGITISTALFIEFFNRDTAESITDTDLITFESVSEARQWFEDHKDVDLVEMGEIIDSHPALYGLIDEYAEYHR